MLNAPSAQLKPNLFGQSAQEEQEQHRELHKFRDTTNLRNRNQRRGKTTFIEVTKENQAPVQGQEGEKPKPKYIKESKESVPKPNLLIQFESEEEQQEVSDPTPPNNLAEARVEHVQTQFGIIPEKKSFLLNLDSDEDEQEAQKLEDKSSKHEEKIEKKQSSNSTDIFSNWPQQKGVRPDFLLDLDAEDSEEEKQSGGSVDSNRVQESEDQNARKLTANLSNIIKEFKERYHLEPIPKGKVFECVVKRDKNGDSVKYHIYDNITLRNFITVLKDQDGYLVISKYESVSTKHINDPIRKERVVGRITSNFFGTEFNCMVEDAPYRSSKEYPPDTKKERVITIEYETNFFGMKGPRKMKSYITTGIGIRGKGLNEVYQEEKQFRLSQKGKKSVVVFRNKPPKWSPDIGSYVLNFDGRATISSVKNFIMIGEEESDKAAGKVLFGKFGKELFNLDIRYPFSILQGVALAVSSFDRKLGCE